LSVERIDSQLKKVREQIAQLQAKEKDLAEQKQMAEDAETMKIIKKYKISSERLRMLNRLSEDEVRQLLQKREQEKEGSTNEKEEVIR
jgi:phosphoribosylanthranilate isomerase